MLIVDLMPNVQNYNSTSSKYLRLTSKQTVLREFHLSLKTNFKELQLDRLCHIGSKEPLIIKLTKEACSFREILTTMIKINFVGSHIQIFGTNAFGLSSINFDDLIECLN